MRLGKRDSVRVELVYGFPHCPGAYVSRRARLGRTWGSEALRLQLREAMLPGSGPARPSRHRGTAAG